MSGERCKCPSTLSRGLARKGRYDPNTGGGESTVIEILAAGRHDNVGAKRPASLEVALRIQLPETVNDRSCQEVHDGDVEMAFSMNRNQINCHDPRRSHTLSAQRTLSTMSPNDYSVLSKQP